jgi:hypothetical protein
VPAQTRHPRPARDQFRHLRRHHPRAYTKAVVDLLADRAPGLLRVLRAADADYILLDGTLAEWERVGGPTSPTSTADMA